MISSRVLKKYFHSHCEDPTRRAGDEAISLFNLKREIASGSPLRSEPSQWQIYVFFNSLLVSCHGNKLNKYENPGSPMIQSLCENSTSENGVGNLLSREVPSCVLECKFIFKEKIFPTSTPFSPLATLHKEIFTQALHHGVLVQRLNLRTDSSVSHLLPVKTVETVTGTG